MTGSRTHSLDVTKTTGALPSMVDHPPHYKQGEIEAIDALAAALGPEGFHAYCRGNALKYVWRSEHKGTSATDLAKAIWYLNRAIESRKA